MAFSARPPFFFHFKHYCFSFSLPTCSTTQTSLSCSECLINKSHKLPFTNSTITSQRPLEYIFSEIWSSPTTSIDNFRYYIVFIDHYSRYTWLYPLKQKSQVKEVFIAYKELVDNKFQHKIGTLFSDNGGEYIALRAFLSTHGIERLTSPPHTPQHNGISERKHRHIVETGLTFLSTASIPHAYWTFAFSAAVYLINRLLSPTISMESPYQKLFGVTPNYEKLRVLDVYVFLGCDRITATSFNHDQVDVSFLVIQSRKAPTTVLTKIQIRSTPPGMYSLLKQSSLSKQSTKRNNQKIKTLINPELSTHSLPFC